jgi:integrase
MRTVERLPSGRYKVRFRHGKKQSSETFDRKKDADRFATLLDALGVQGALDQLYEDEQQAAVPTLDAVAADHIRLLTGITDGTRLTYTRLWARTWGPLLGSTPANRITADSVREAVNSLAGHYSAKSLENQRGILSAVLKRCVELGHLSKNPARGIRLPRTGEDDRTEMRIINPEEWADLEERIAEHYRPFVRFLAATGCRWGEAVALTVGDVALPNVRFRRALKWSPDSAREVGPTKTRKSNRTVALPAEIHDDLRAACHDKKRGDLVWTAPRGGAILHRTFWSRVWLPAVEHMDPRPRIHDVRHSHASWLLGAGIPITVVQARLGHEKISTTVDTYGHLLPDAQIKAAEAASLVFGGRRALEG